MISEATLKSEFMKQAQIHLPVPFLALRHEDKLTSGIPDITLTFFKRTIWIEAKYANPNIISRHVQDITVKRLAIAGNAWYTVYRVNPATGAKETYLVDPKTVSVGWVNFSFDNRPFFEGFDHISLIKEIIRRAA